MRRMGQFPWLSALVVVAVLASVPPVAFAQTETGSSAASPQSPLQANPAPVPPPPDELGDTLMAHQRYQAAIAAYKQAPAGSAAVLNKMGIAYQMMFNLDDASRCYQASLKLEPRNTRVLNNLATVYDSEKKYGEAERMYRKALRIDPDSALILKNLGTDLMAQHKYKKGWEAYQAALAQDPMVFESNGSPRVENPASIAERGAMNFYMAKGCMRAGKTARAIEYLRMALNEGFTTPHKIIADDEFAALREVPAFQQLLAAQRAQ